MQGYAGQYMDLYFMWNYALLQADNEFKLKVLLTLQVLPWKTLDSRCSLKILSEDKTKAEVRNKWVGWVEWAACGCCLFE